MPESQPEPNSLVARRFASTRWSIVLAAGQRSSPDAAAALQVLCETYWYPLYAWARRRGFSRDDARELTQEFFVRLLEEDFLRSADQDKGRFRTFLLTVFQRFATKQRIREQAVRRGGACRHLSLDFDDGERRYLLEPAHEVTPEVLFDRQWALILLDRVMGRLSHEYAERGKSALFEALRESLTPGTNGPRSATVAADLRMTEGAVRVAVHRLRERYRALLREEVAATIDDGASVDEELQLLRKALRRP